MYQNQIFLDETGCILNEKMMPGVAVEVLKLETGKNVLKSMFIG
jgi:hypothetical protein